MTAIHNYFERLVLESIRDKQLPVDMDTIEDIACLALNELPAKYIRHDVDMAFYTSPQDMAALRERVERAVRAAIVRVLDPKRSARR